MNKNKHNQTHPHMNRNMFLATVMILASTFYLLTNCREKEGVFEGKASPQEKEDSSRQVPDELAGKDDGAHGGGTARPPTPKSKGSIEVRALLAMTKLMADAIQPEMTLERLVTKLVEYGVEPEISRSGSADTGDLTIVRSTNPFRGTRYFHAQYFGGSGMAPFPQHISFEFRPGPKALEEVVSAVKKTFPLARPVEETAAFKKWDLGEDYILWIKKMDSEDLEDNVFNAYDEADLGTIQIAIELEIHDEEEDGHSH